MRQCAAQFSGVCDRHVLLVLPRPFNLEFKALEEKKEETAFYFIEFNVIANRITLHLSVMFCVELFLYFLDAMVFNKILTPTRDLPQGPAPINRPPPRNRKESQDLVGNGRRQEEREKRSEPG